MKPKAQELTKSTISEELEFREMYSEMANSHIKPLWTDEARILPRSPEPRAVPWLWKWSQIYRLASRAGELVTIERGGDRRALGLSNPGLDGQPYATPTLWAAIQWLNSREIEPAHRHSAQAVRFMIKGKAYSTVQGDKIELERGDFAINPPMAWHDHGSENDGPAVWMDGLDIPLNNYLNATFFEEGAKDRQESPRSSKVRCSNTARVRFGPRGKSRFKNTRPCPPISGPPLSERSLTSRRSMRARSTTPRWNTPIPTTGDR